MKPSKFFIFIFTLAAWLPSTQADVVPFPQDGDLFMGFHSPNATNEYLWDIGQYTQFDGKPVGYQIVIGTISVDLSTVFGAGWATDPNVQNGDPQELLTPLLNSSRPKRHRQQAASPCLGIGTQRPRKP